MNDPLMNALEDAISDLQEIRRLGDRIAFSSEPVGQKGESLGLRKSMLVQHLLFALGATSHEMDRFDFIDAVHSTAKKTLTEDELFLIGTGIHQARAVSSGV